MVTRSAEERRQVAKVAYDAYLASCPSRVLLDRIGDKWVALVICALRDGPQRYSELSRHLAGISQKMLTQTLRALERDGLISRHLTPGVPPRVDYALTELGVSLLGPIQVLKDWAEQNMDEVRGHQERYDAAAG